MLPENYEKIHQIFKPDSITAILDRINNFPDQIDPFIKEIQILIKKNSPLSMYLSFEIVKRGKNLTVEEALQ
jgi:hypothetical protein